eukprot:Hpha_TRINITY_DN29598_c0_g1::TRINITY_DN29598_c0_g1_i1::g.156992::m.156992
MSARRPAPKGRAPAPSKGGQAKAAGAVESKKAAAPAAGVQRRSTAASAATGGQRRSTVASAANSTATASVPPSPVVGCVLGGTVWAAGRPAVVRYLGPTYFGDGHWVGLQFSSAEDCTEELLAIAKKHSPPASQAPRDGCVAGTKYFVCTPGQALFLRREDVTEQAPPRADTPKDPSDPPTPASSSEPTAGHVVARTSSLLRARRETSGSSGVAGTPTLCGWTAADEARSPPVVPGRVPISPATNVESEYKDPAPPYPEEPQEGSAEALVVATLAAGAAAKAVIAELRPPSPKKPPTPDPVEDTGPEFGCVGEEGLLGTVKRAAEEGKRLCAAALSRTSAPLPTAVDTYSSTHFSGDTKKVGKLVELLPPRPSAECPPLYALEAELRGMQGCSEAAGLLGSAAAALRSGGVSDELHGAWAAAAMGDVSELQGIRKAMTAVGVDTPRGVAASEAMKRALFECEEAQHEIEAAITDGDVGRAEAAYKNSVQLQERAQLLRQQNVQDFKDRRTPAAEELVKGVTERRHEAQKLLDELAGACRESMEWAEGEVATVGTEWEKAEQALHLRRGRAVSRAKEAGDALRTNAVEADGAWAQITHLVGLIKGLEEARLRLATERVAAAAELAITDAELRRLGAMAAQRRSAGEYALRQAAAASEATRLLRHASAALLVEAESNARDHLRGVFERELKAHEEHQQGYRQVYLTLGDLRGKKEQHLRQIEGRLENTIMKHSMAAESLDPTAKDHAQRRDELEALRVTAQSQLTSLEERSATHQESFNLLSAGPLRAAGREVADPALELERINDARAGKVSAYHELLKGGDPSVPKLPWQPDPAGELPQPQDGSPRQTREASPLKSPGVVGAGPEKETIGEGESPSKPNQESEAGEGI